jgi:hypothetical protein
VVVVAVAVTVETVAQAVPVVVRLPLTPPWVLRAGLQVLILLLVVMEITVAE